MLSYQVPNNAYKRIIQNDKSDQFKIILNLKNINDQDQNISIEKHSQIMITTTINKARIISKTIDEMYTIDPSLQKFEFEINNNLNNHKIKIDEIVELFKLILESVETEVIIPENKKDIFSSILNILGEEKINAPLILNHNEKDNDNDNSPNGDPKNIIFQCDFEGDELSGIISCLKQMTGQGPDFNGCNGIKLSSGGTEDESYPIVNIIKYDKDHINDYFYNFLMPLKYDEGWIEFDFGNRKINVSSYTIRTSGFYAYHPKSWQIVGSNDNMNWDVIDIQVDNPILNEKFKQHRFTCEKSNKFYQFIRYIALDTFKNDVYNNSICLTCIEFFGSISTPE